MIGDEAHLPYDRPPLSKELLRGEWTNEKLALRRKSYEELSVDLRAGIRATAPLPNERRVELEDGSSVDYDGLVIATGARVRTLPNQPDLEGIFTLRTLDDAMGLRDAF